MNIRALHLAAWCLTGAVSLAATAEPPQGGGPGPRRYEYGGGPGGGPGGGGPGFRGYGGGDPVTAEEWQKFREQLTAFCVKHSPRRWEEIESRLRRHGPQARVGFSQMASKFKELMKYAKEDPALHAIKVRQIEVEDAEYGLITDLRGLDKADEQRAAELRGKLREQNLEYVKLRLRERSHRIDRLNRMIEQEKQQVAADGQRADVLADERLADLEKQGPDFFFSRWGRRERDSSSTAPAPAPAPPPATDGPK